MNLPFEALEEFPIFLVHEFFQENSLRLFDVDIDINCGKQLCFILKFDHKIAVAVKSRESAGAIPLAQMFAQLWLFSQVQISLIDARTFAAAIALPIFRASQFKGD